MADADMAATQSDRLLELVGCLEREAGFAEVVESLSQGHAATLDGVWGSSSALVAAALAAHAPATLLVVCPRIEQVDQLLAEAALFTRLKAERFPASESFERSELDDVFGERLHLLKLLQRATATQPPAAAPASAAPPSPALPKPPAAPKLVIASIQSLLQPVPSRETLARHTRLLRIGDSTAVDDLAKWLVENGFVNTSAVELPGEFSIRGGILDIFAPDWDEPARIEFFGDEIESIRRFEITGQRSLESLDAVEVTVVGSAEGDAAHLSDYLPPQSWFLLLEPTELEQRGRQYGEQMETPTSVGRAAEPSSQDSAAAKKSWPAGKSRAPAAIALHSVTDVFKQVFRFPSIAASAVATGSLETTGRLKIESVERFSGDINRVRDELDEAGAGQQLFVLCQTEAEVQRLTNVFAATKAAREGRLHFPLGLLENGFRLVPEQIVLLSSGELFHRTDLRRPTRRRLSKVIDTFLELREGDLVVHVAHGIARYRGLKLLEKNGQIEEHLELEFHEKTKLFVPSTKIGLVQKYIGGTKSRPTLGKLGGRLWGRQKERVEGAVADLAAEMLELQATRAARPGIPFPADSEWQREFDASFPYQETPDQILTIEAIKRDMCLPRPMDRLLCGDVGYGKTELAMRAAFKAVNAGYQAAILVPTTLLCEQHLRTFSARMAEFPITIAALSRFATRKQQTETIRQLEDGSLDIVIGTHRLAQPDVRFHNLGLVIIDEEQRFGVEVKERLKSLRQTVDVLTMTATPIPRTLHMGLLGLRDISNLETPPQDRLAVETRVARFDADLIRSAVLRELNRQGQIYFVHNRVEDIEIVARRLRQIVPEAKMAIAHGQMHENDLEEIMLAFIDRRFDLLLATTIIESGLDIPNANTIFINEGDRYGLADLHQLRGRVGRYKHRAYCHLLIDPNKNLSPSAAKRLRAIEEFSDMGAGFAIAMRDLEIRGAGNILGAEQSGHIATIGYELYCDLLEHAVRELKQLPPKTSIEVDVDLPGEGYVPRDYVPDLRLKIDLYRRLGRVSTLEELVDFRAELADRFGAPPPMVEHLLTLAEIRIAAHRWQITTIHLENDFAVFRYASAGRIRELAATNGGKLRIVDGKSAYLPLEKGVAHQKSVLAQVKSLLQQG
jgi:transcription-repair coupling factor (superfamily II helicase)